MCQKEAEKTLSTKPIGSFMLRLEENGFIALSVRSKDFRNIVQDYVPYGTDKYEKDTKETIIKAIEELTPAKYPVLRKMPSLGTIHTLRKHFYSTKINLTFQFFTKTGFFRQIIKRISFSTLLFDEIFMIPVV